MDGTATRTVKSAFLVPAVYSPTAYACASSIACTRAHPAARLSLPGFGRVQMRTRPSPQCSPSPSSPPPLARLPYRLFDHHHEAMALFVLLTTLRPREVFAHLRPHIHAHIVPLPSSATSIGRRSDDSKRRWRG
ncbi:hypothetical protein C8R44DRAFT_863429 [Mycena epipterygia]|nr:hypothetical protein C8R44DRAFT_863429 [Mycena epipterygia]